MPYIIRTCPGKEKSLAKALTRLGLPFRIPLISGYLITEEPLPETLSLYCASAFVAISEEEAQRLTSAASSEDIAKGDMVKALSGPYKGVCGIVSKVTETLLYVNISVFGRVMAVELHRQEAEKILNIPPWESKNAQENR
ncbi:MAG: hypothetical protein WC291_00570 [Thermodesulfovibrionales bacterium]|jgi:transcription antitermination factor NusG